MAGIGVGMQGPWNVKQFLQEGDCKVVAICDIDKNNLRDGVEMVNSHYGNKDPLLMRIIGRFWRGGTSIRL